MKVVWDWINEHLAVYMQDISHVIFNHSSDGCHSRKALVSQSYFTQSTIGCTFAVPRGDSLIIICYVADSQPVSIFYRKFENRTSSTKPTVLGKFLFRK